jgi:hypothetical protein
MSSKYVPPHKRSHIQVPVSSRKTTFDEKEFVPLSLNEEPKTASKIDWKSVNFENTRTLDILPPPPISIPIRRQPERVFENDEYSDDSDNSQDVGAGHTGPIDDGWTIVEKKVKIKRDKVQEALDNDDAPLSDEDEEESYWNDQPEEYETYWDRKP